MQKHGSDINDRSVLNWIEGFFMDFKVMGLRKNCMKNCRQILQLGVNVNAGKIDFSRWFTGLQHRRRREVAKLLLSEGFDLQLLHSYDFGKSKDHLENILAEENITFFSVFGKMMNNGRKHPKKIKNA